MTLKEARLAAGLTQRGMSELLRIAEAKSQTEKPED